MLPSIIFSTENTAIERVSNKSLSYRKSFYYKYSYRTDIERVSPRKL